MKRISAVLVFLVLLFATVPSFAQTNVNEEQGLKPYDSLHGGDIDSVSLTNGGLTLHVPLASFPQRGNLDLSFQLLYSTKQWVVGSKPVRCIGGGGAGNCQIDVWRPSRGFSGARIASSLDWMVQTNSPDSSGYNQFVFSPDGNSHLMGGSNQPVASILYPAYSLDVTGLMLADGQTLVQPNGTRFSYVNGAGALSGGAAGIIQPSSVTDANGNRITISSSGWTDTLGRLIPGSAQRQGAQQASSATQWIQAGVLTTDLSNCPTGTASAYVWTLPGSRTYKFCYSNLNLQTAFNISGVIDFGPVQQYLLTTVVLPDLTTWTLSYDSYGDISTITFPTGGSITYQYTNRSMNCSNDPTNVSRWVTSRTVNPGGGAAGQTWNYTFQPGAAGAFTMTATDPAGNDTVHSIVDLGNGACNFFETQAQYFQGSATSGTLLKTVATQYDSNLSSFMLQSGAAPVAVNVRARQTTLTLPGGHTSKVVNTYDSGAFSEGDGSPVVVGSVLQKDEYGYSGNIERTTVNHYTWQDAASVGYKNANFVSLIQYTTVKDGVGNQVAQTSYGYDEGSLVASTTGGVQQVAAPAGNLRGNPTTTCAWLNTSNSNICKRATYFDDGMLATSIDALGNTASFTYSSNYAGAYLTQTNLPDTGSPPVHHVISATYDFNTGVMTSFTDQNGQVFSIHYDPMLRLTEVDHPDGGMTSFTYPNLNEVDRSRKIDANRSDTFAVKLDGFGRTIHTLHPTPACTITTDTTYDALGRSASVSNPYCTTSDFSYGITRYAYDALGRATTTTKQDTSTTQASYADNCVTTTDEAGNQRRACNDAFGRLIEVDEPGGTPASLSTPLVTLYKYDTLGNLLCIEQHGGVSGSGCTTPGSDPTIAPTVPSPNTWRVRTFTYDSLSRLLISNNPESGVICYGVWSAGHCTGGYDANGNLLAKTDARGITTTYFYDSLNRLYQKNYSDQSPSAYFAYDRLSYYTNANGIGRLAMAWNNLNRATVYDYDAMGRVTYQQDTNGNGVSIGNTSAQYNLLGGLTQLTHPNGQVVTYSYDSAAQLVSAIDQINNINFVTAATYSPSSTTYVNGQTAGFAGITATVVLNNRLQPCRITADTNGQIPTNCINAFGNRMDLAYDFHLGNGDNGRVYARIRYGDQTRNQTFTYDALNRLASAQNAGTDCTQKALGGATKFWGNNYTYDSWGNLLQKQVTKCSSESLLVSADTNNRIHAGTTPDYGYDPSGAGYMTNDALHTYTFNAEGQVAQVDNGAALYSYSADGHRVRKDVGSAYREYIIFGGSTIAEKEASGWTNYIFFGGERVSREDPDKSIHFYFHDLLNSTAVITDANGNTQSEADYSPWGGEIGLVATDRNHYKFTGQERDQESGLDHFEARNYSSALGRWTSADWSAVPAPVPYASLGNPQSLNLYAYVKNDPTSMFDTDGHWSWDNWQSGSAGGGKPVKTAPLHPGDKKLPGPPAGAGRDPHDHRNPAHDPIPPHPVWKLGLVEEGQHSNSGGNGVPDFSKNDNPWHDQTLGPAGPLGACYTEAAIAKWKHAEWVRRVGSGAVSYATDIFSTGLLFGFFGPTGTIAEVGTVGRAGWVGASGQTAARAVGSVTLKLSKEAAEGLARGDASLAIKESIEFAKGASGPVNVYLGDGMGNMFYNYELPAFINNPAVTNINQIVIPITPK